MNLNHSILTVLAVWNFGRLTVQRFMNKKITLKNSLLKMTLKQNLVMFLCHLNTILADILLRMILRTKRSIGRQFTHIIVKLPATISHTNKDVKTYKSLPSWQKLRYDELAGEKLKAFYSDMIHEEREKSVCIH